MTLIPVPGQSGRTANRSLRSRPGLEDMTSCGYFAHKNCPE